MLTAAELPHLIMAIREPDLMKLSAVQKYDIPRLLRNGMRTLGHAGVYL